MPVAITESSPFAQAATPAEGPGRLLIRLIDAGRGSSGVYPAETLKAAAEAKVFPAGTHMRIDHQTEQERYERPEGSVWDTAAVLMEDARWDEPTQSLVAEARVYSRFRTMLAEMADDIGVSIRANAETEVGEWDGQPARIVTRLVEANTVDFVTRAGRGGHIVEVLEAARVEEARNVGQWVESRIHADFTKVADEMFGDGRLTREERITLSSAIGAALDAFVTQLEAGAPELYTRDLWDVPPLAAAQAIEAAVRRGIAEATVNDRQEQLNALIKDAYGGKSTWPWVRDFDDTSVWFEIDGGDEGGTFQQPYETTDDVATSLTGDRTEVRATTQYIPIAAAESAAPTLPVIPAGQSTTPQSQEDTMPQIEESRLRDLEEAHGRVPALESERDTAVQRAELAERRAAVAEATSYAQAFARKRVTEANPELPMQVVDRIVGEATRDIPLTDELRLDTEKVGESADKARTSEESYLARIAEESGIGSVRGVGQTSQAAQVSEADIDRQIAKAFGRIEKGA